jgi:signal transduction histidine kinase
LTRILAKVDARASIEPLAFAAVQMRYLARSARDLAPPPVDVLLALGLAAWGQIDLWLVGGSFTQVPGPHAATAPFLLLFTLPLAWRRRWPFGVLLTVTGAIAAESLIVGRSPEGGEILFPTLIVLYSVGAYADRDRAVAGFVLGVAAITIDTIQDPSHEVASLAGVVVASGFFGVFLGGAAWLVGRHVRSRRIHAEQFEQRALHLEREQSEFVQAAAEAERVRIARELHDVVAHSVSLMGVQAGAAERVMERDPDRARDALSSIQATSREAIGELRRLLSVLRTAEQPSELAPQPGLGSLDPLVARAREGGIPVELRIDGEPGGIPTGVELSAYRVVQEALTNVRKHAPGAATRVNVNCLRDRIELTVENETPAAGNGNVEEGRHQRGYGLVGMRERVALYGGDLAAGPRARGGFAVQVTLPIEVE